MLIIGIDPAWTAKNPSGVAVLQFEKQHPPGLVLLGRSYDEILSLEKGDPLNWYVKVSGSVPLIAQIIRHIERVLQDEVVMVAMDIPLSPNPITSRRAADSVISHLYGNKYAATHSPTPERPGKIAEIIYQELTSVGFEWVGISKARGNHIFAEVYPHTAIIEMLKLAKRLPYKESKRRSYWPDKTPEQRNELLQQSFSMLYDALEKRISNLRGLFPSPDATMRPAWALKSYEDCLDALVCAWVGYQIIARKAKAYGDDVSAIWVPED